MHRNIAFFTLILLAFANVLCAQPPQIPGIQQQPQWAMPFFFEDANGDKDTVWIGYDPAAQSGPNDPDPQFEKFDLKESVKFQAALWPTSPYPYGSGDDSVKKVEATRYYYPDAKIGFINGKMPITMKWVDSLFNSDSLPYPDISPRPRARADFDCMNSRGAYFPCYFADHKWHVLTSYIAPSFFLVFTDSVVFIGHPDYSAEQLEIDLIIQPHDAPSIGGSIARLEELGFKVYSSPVVHHLVIESQTAGIAQYVIADLYGREVVSGSIESPLTTIDLSMLPPGAYVVRLMKGQHIAGTLIIKQ